MGPFPIVVIAPSSELFSRIRERIEPLYIQAFVAQASVETFNEAILNRPAWAYEAQLHTVLNRPGLNCSASELAAVIQGDVPWRRTTFFDCVLQRSNHMTAMKRAIRHQRDALSGELIDDRKDPVGAPIGKPVADEIG